MTLIYLLFVWIYQDDIPLIYVTKLRQFMNDGLEMFQRFGGIERFEG